MIAALRRQQWWLLALAIALVAPIVADERQTFLLMTIVVLVVFATSYNVLLGYTGMVSFAHAAYYGAGAYTVALLWFHQDVPVLVGLVLSPLVAGALAFVTGLVAMRAVRLYFALLTLALGQIVYLVAFQWRSVTRGDDGIHGIEVPSFIAGTDARYYFLVGVAAVALVVMGVALRAPFGAALRAIRENPERTSFLGLDVKRYQIAAYTMAGTFAGLAGGMFALVDRSAYPGLLHWTKGSEPIYVTLIGGLNAFPGPAIGAVIYGYLHDVTTRRLEYWGTVLGAVLLAIILFMPGGVTEALERMGRAVRRRHGGPPAAPTSPSSTAPSASPTASRTTAEVP